MDLAGCGQGPLAYFSLVTGDRKNRQQAVSHEFEHLGPMVEDHRYLAIEITVEKVNQHSWRLTIGQRGESAHVRQPDGGVNLLDVAPPDMPGENALTSVMPDIGIEQIACQATQSANLGDPRQRRHDGFEGGDLRIGEATRLPLCAGHRMNVAVAEDERR